MAASTDFDYANILSLEKAKIRKRSRLNFLGSRELIIQYPQVSPAQKEECIEWLEDNRLTLTNQDITFKTLTGVYKCIEITYDDNNAVLIQRFKIDSKLGGYTTDGAGTGVDTSMAISGKVEKTYFWRIVDPSAITLPSTPTAGVIWDMSDIDNGDGTYDVTVTKRTTTGYEMTSESFSETAFYKQYTLKYNNTTEIDAQTWFAAQAATPTYFTPDGTAGNYTVPVGYTLDIDNSNQEDGLFSARVVVREAKTNIFKYVLIPGSGGGAPPALRERVGYNVDSLSDFILGTGDFAATPAIDPYLYDVGYSMSINEFGLLQIGSTEQT